MFEKEQPHHQDILQLRNLFKRAWRDTQASRFYGNWQQRSFMSSDGSVYVLYVFLTVEVAYD
jgi:hypothetical protein